MKVLRSMCKQIWKTQQWPQSWKRSVSFRSQRMAMPKKCSNYCTVALISHASKVMLKILQARLQQLWTRLQQYMNWELPDDKLDLEKTEEPEIKLPASFGLWKIQGNSRKTSLLTVLKLLAVWNTTNYGRFLKRWEYQTTWPASWEICMQVKKQQLELDMEQQTGSK